MEIGTETARALDNPVWHGLRGPHARLAQRDPSGRALRYDPEVSIFSGVDQLDAAGWNALAALAGPEGVAVLFRSAIGPVPAGWREQMRLRGLQMVAGDLAPAAALDTTPLDPSHAAEMVALAQLTEPGPFLARTVDLGGYRGVVRGGRLLAMAGERFRVPGWTEISAVCTHPDARRQGLGAALTLTIAEQIRSRGDRPFLHAVDTNRDAIRLYESLGFAVRRRVDVVAAQWAGPDA